MQIYYNLKKIICRVQFSQIYSIMINKSTNLNVIGHLVMFTTIIKKSLPMIVFSSLFEIEGGKKMLLLFIIII